MPSDTIAAIEEWVTAVRRPVGKTPTSPASQSPPSRQVQDLKFDCRELERELARARTELDRARMRRDIAEAETAGLRETLQSHIPSKEERDRRDALR